VVVQELIAKLGFQVDRQGLDTAEKGLSKIAKDAAKLYVAYQAASKAFGLVVDSVKGAARLESMNAEFEVMLGNAEAAKYLVQQIQQFAAVTPYHTAELTQNVRLMMAFGQSANESLSAVKMLGDVAGSDSEKLGRLSLAYAQVMAAGKLQGQDLLQFVNAGFNPLQEISAKTGKSIGTLRAEMEKGLISSTMVSEAFASATGVGGRFFGNMEKQSQTLNGLWSTLTDNFQIMMAELGGQLVPFIKDVLIVLIDLGDEIAGAYRQLGDFFTLMFSDGPTAGDIASGIAASFQTIADAIMAIGAGFQYVMVIADVFQGVFATVVGSLVDIIMAIPKAFAYAGKGLSMIVGAVAKLTGNRELAAYNAQQRAELDQFTGTGGFLEYNQRAADNSMDAIGSRWNKAGALASMIGGSKARDPGAKVSMTDNILKALEGRGKVVNNTVNVNNTIHAEGTMKDILQEQANSVFGLTFQQRLIAAAV
jgi:tape measure domain-containing protein